MCFNTVAMPTPSSNSESSPPPFYPHLPTEVDPMPACGSGVAPKGSIRKRVVRACEVCRRKKVKCNGQKPCSHCIAFAEECFYVDVKDRSAYSRRYVESLELRLAKLERAWAMVFENGGLGHPSQACQGCFLQRDRTDASRRASDPGTSAPVRLQNLSVDVPSMANESLVMEMRSSVAKRRVSEDNGVFVSPRGENKRLRAATLSQIGSQATTVPIPSSGIPLRMLPQSISNESQSHLGAHLDITNPSHLNQAAPLQWPQDGGLESFFQESVTLLPLPPSQPNTSPSETLQAQTCFDPNQEELTGLLRQFMDQESSHRPVESSQLTLKQMQQ